MLRLMGMRFLVVLTLAATACSGSSDASRLSVAANSPSAAAATATPGETALGSDFAAYPSEFRGACGHPGAKVRVKARHLVIRHADCDLTGVYLLNRTGSAGSDLPKPGEVSVNTAGVTVEVAIGTQDVTFTQE